MQYLPLYTLLIFVFCISCKGQDKTELPKGDNKSESREGINYTGPNSITRNIIQSRNGDIWIASWEGVFRYDGKDFTNVTSEVSSARFFSLLEDSKGNMWFGSIGSGVYYYDGNSFRHFTIKEGLLNNDVGSIYEDKKGNIWFGVFGGASRYDGKVFRNYIINGNVMNEDRTGVTFKDRRPYEVNSIVEDKTGNLWFGTRGNTFIYDEGTFSVVKRDGSSPFINVRCIIEDKEGNIWLGGNDGLWRSDGSTFTNIAQHFVGYIYEDTRGNIWTSSVRTNSPVNSSDWVLSRYDEASLSNQKPTASAIHAGSGMLFGILEDKDGNIWFGANGVYRYDGSKVTAFKDKAVKE